ncbi:hypothetical protein DPMN_027450 [Dreissena polymorpha]|uniref:AAA+ ATPase domain-containing protein n=1 Tax=Dreissena polymorpha TaxID=45954 RepID=A0A9D4LVA6_DREPO|nr:hypothetical protein DPMN_027450 [Dreissena polymorpha]
MDVKSSSRLKENTPKKKAFSLQTNNSPAKKPAGKIAPMFLLGKKKSDVAASPKKPPLDPEVARQRQEFLSSGVPEELRKQTAVRLAAQGVQGYPPLPTISHVQQISAPVCSGGVDVWRLGQVELTLRQLLDHRIVYPESIFNGDMISGSHIGATTPILLCNRIKPPCMSPDIVELCLSEISAVNPAFPVRQFYTALFEMKTETEKPPPKSESMLKTDMKGILAGCTDMVVIDDGEEVQGTSKKGRSLKLKKKGKQDNAAGEAVEKGAVENTPANCGLLWTEKYCPAKSCDVLGNTAVLKKLQAWLSEWKHVLDREARKARKLLLKKQKGRPINNKRNEDTAWDDDSDFDLDSEDSEEDDSLCNTMLMSGPHGCGKTSSVYALALEQGFKVHEVNASSCRSGKQILSQLQEATQSHQVSSQGSHTPRKHTALGTCSQEGKVQPASKMPTAFTNLFKKGGASQHPSDPPPAQDSKKRKRKKSGKDSSPSTRQAKGPEGLKSRAQHLALEDTSSQSAATRSLNLSSTTLILFDEVDVVFEEDRGFLSAIQTFMSNTKVPIILTTADPAFSTALEGRFELVTLKRPPVCSIASYMQTLCTVEGLRTDAGTLQQVAKLHNCDMRRCLLHLQYFILSGGDNFVSYRPFVTTAVANHNGSSLLPRQESNSSCTNSTSQSSQEGTKKQSIETSANFHDNDDDDDFVTLKPVRKRARILDEDSSSLQGTPDIAPSKPDMSGDSKVVMESGKCPPVHSLGMAVAENVRQCLQHTSPESRAQLISICAQLKPVTPAHLMYNNLHVLLPYQLKIVDSMEALCPRDRIEPFLKTRKRIKLNSDLYDSEASNDCLEDSSQKCKSQERNSNSADVQEEAGITVGDKVNITEVKTECNTDSNSEKFSKENHTILGKSLSQFSKFYDTMSEIDQMESKVSLQIGHSLIGVNNRQIKGSLIAGLENNLPKFDPINELDLEQCWEYSSEIEGRSAARVYQECVKLQAQVGNLSEDQSNFTDSHMVLPVLKGQEQFSLVDRSHFTPPADYCSATDNIVDNLPLLTHSSRRTLHLDYLPFVRDVCRTEQARQLVNTKRRFHHYFDSIGWPLKEKTMVTMATTFFSTIQLIVGAVLLTQIVASMNLVLRKLGIMHGRIGVY